MDSLLDRLKAALDEDEQIASHFRNKGWSVDTYVGDEYNHAVVDTGRNGTTIRCGIEVLDEGEEYAEHIARHDPARVLRQAEGARKMIEWLTRMDAIVSNDNLWNVSTCDAWEALAEMLNVEEMP